MSVKATLLISVIIPAYNAARFIAEAIASVYAQHWPEIQIIVIDDGSHDDTESIVKQFKNVVYICQDHSGPSAARNLGIKLAKGDLISFLDADDLYPSNKFDLQGKYLQKNPEVMFVGGMIKNDYSEAEHIINEYYDEIDEKANLHWHLGACLFRKECFEIIGPFNEEMKHAEDVDWWLRAVERSLPYHIHYEITLIYRLHGSNMTRDVKTNRFYFLKALKQSISRRRLDQGEVYPLPSIFHHQRELHPKTNNPLVSVFIINRKGNFQDVIRSVKNIHYQSYRPIEIVLIGDKTNWSAKNQEWFEGIRDLTKINGQIDLKDALVNSSGMYAAFLQSGCMWSAQKLRFQINDLIMENRPFSFTLINHDKKTKEHDYLLNTLVAKKTFLMDLNANQINGLLDSIKRKDKAYEKDIIPIDFSSTD